ncbi:MAG: hypothetical protein J5656_03670 [Clostridia bacterium]|nr:hypothetical protein [Clostridia bacterium]
MNELNKQILSRVKKEKYGAFSTSDFLDLAPYKSISKALELMEDSKIICRARRGIYYLSEYDATLMIYKAPSILDIATAIARQFNWIIIPSGNYALNIVGISTQVPTKYVFVSSGPYNEYEVKNNTIIFKHATSKEITNYSYNILIAIQALKTIKKENVNQDIINKLKCFLTSDDIIEIKAKRNNITSWIYETLSKIVGE